MKIIPPLIPLRLLRRVASSIDRAIHPPVSSGRTKPIVQITLPIVDSTMLRFAIMVDRAHSDNLEDFLFVVARLEGLNYNPREIRAIIIAKLTEIIEQYKIKENGVGGSSSPNVDELLSDGIAQKIKTKIISIMTRDLGISRDSLSSSTGRENLKDYFNALLDAYLPLGDETMFGCLEGLGLEFIPFKGDKYKLVSINKEELRKLAKDSKAHIALAEEFAWLKKKKSDIISHFLTDPDITVFIFNAENKLVGGLSAIEADFSVKEGLLRKTHRQYKLICMEGAAIADGHKKEGLQNYVAYLIIKSIYEKAARKKVLLATQSQNWIVIWSLYKHLGLILDYSKPFIQEALDVIEENILKCKELSITKEGFCQGVYIDQDAWGMGRATEVELEEILWNIHALFSPIATIKLLRLMAELDDTDARIWLGHVTGVKIKAMELFLDYKELKLRYF